MPLESCGEILESTHINVNTLQGGEPFFSRVVVQIGTSQLELMVYFHLPFSTICVKATDISYILQMFGTTSRISKEK